MVNLSGIEHYIPNVAAMLGVEPATVLLFVAIAVAVANFTGRMIPDDKTGVLGAIRHIAKFIGMYASNRVSTGLTVNDVVRTTVPIIDEINDTAEALEQKVAAFPGINQVNRDPATGKFQKGKQ